uniref:Uncharacterized protein n=1 Tax=Anguilla anguilla TaxID=7936 RepID=A0A0E9UNP8_ANGAN
MFLAIRTLTAFQFALRLTQGRAYNKGSVQ